MRTCNVIVHSPMANGNCEFPVANAQLMRKPRSCRSQRGASAGATESCLSDVRNQTIGRWHGRDHPRAVSKVKGSRKDKLSKIKLIKED
ncbi:hypothetical protein PIB30_079694 [Stylosanthes scabra]|uniref:Uncharacterized protein n=1 Tax=Stylosanthes scabra TaxID=79078 RepID=A0ABU6QRU2_9FABA|nr:hypothetical protein [Stylosanthes scabra]